MLFLALTAFVSCRVIKPTEPNLPPSEIAVEPLPPSKIDVPITVDLTTTFADLNNNVPSSQYSDNWPNWQGSGNCRVEYKWFFGRTPLNFQLAGQSINVSSVGSYGAEARVRPCCGWLCPWVGASCGTKKNLKELTPDLLQSGFKKEHIAELDKLLGETDEIFTSDNYEFNEILTTKAKREPPRQIRIGISSNVSLQSNYQLKTTTSLSQFDPVNRCRITFLNIDITDKILEKTRPKISDALGKFDQKMGEYNFRSKIEPIWAKLFEPIPVENIGFLSINPEQVRLSSLNGSGSKVDFSIGLTAKPTFSLIQPNPPQPLPPLPDISENPPGNAFNIYVDGKLQYAPLASYLNTELQKLGNIPIDGGYINLSNAEISGQSNFKLVLKVYLTGKVKGIKYKGWLYLTGTPTYNALTNELSLPDLDYTLETRNILLRIANWLLNSRVRQILQDRAKWDISQTLSSVKQNLQAAINRAINENISTEGTIDNLGIVGIISLKDFILKSNNNGSQQKYPMYLCNPES